MKALRHTFPSHAAHVAHVVPRGVSGVSVAYTKLSPVRDKKAANNGHRKGKRRQRRRGKEGFSASDE